MSYIKRQIEELFYLLHDTDTPIDEIAVRMNMTKDDVVEFLYSDTCRQMFIDCLRYS